MQAQARTIGQLQEQLRIVRTRAKRQAVQIRTLSKKQKQLSKKATAKKETLTSRDALMLLLFSLLLLVPVVLIYADLLAAGSRLKELAPKRPGAFQASDLTELARGTPGLARYSMAALIFLILGWVVAYLFVSGTNVEVAKSIVTTLAGLLAGIVGFYFGTRSKEEAAQAPATSSAQPLTVLHTIPVDKAPNVSRKVAIRASFNRPLDPASVTGPSFVLLDQSGNPVASSVSYEAATWSAVLTPTAELGPKAEHTAQLTTEIKAQAGGPLAEPYSWRFTTGDT